MSGSSSLSLNALPLNPSPPTPPAIMSGTIPSSNMMSAGRSFYTKIQDEARSNLAFRFTLIGAILAVFGALLSTILTVFVEKMTLMIRALLINLVLTTVIMVAAVYTNYCLVNGKCNVWAGIQAAIVFISSIFIVVMPIVMSLVTKGRLPKVSDNSNMTMMSSQNKRSKSKSR